MLTVLDLPMQFSPTLSFRPASEWSHLIHGQEMSLLRFLQCRYEDLLTRKGYLSATIVQTRESQQDLFHHKSMVQFLMVHCLIDSSSEETSRFELFLNFQHSEQDVNKRSEKYDVWEHETIVQRME